MSKSLAPINDINLKIFDEICEEQFKNIDLECILISIIDNVPSDALPHLAEQYHVTGNEGWIQSKNDTDKRSLIKNAIKMHRHKGTKYSIERVFQTLSLDGEVIEWFEYGGNPYYFKVAVDIFNQIISQDTEQNLRDLINEYKNERSWLESVQINLCSLCSQKIYSTFTTEEHLEVIPKESV